MKHLLTVAYDGTNYHGYQVQRDRLTVAGTLQDAIESLLGKRYPLTGCSRTDSGVHARDFKATVSYGEDMPRISEKDLPSALNSSLPHDISVLSAITVPDGFHPRYSVKLKEYEYLILNTPQRDPFLLNRAYHYPKRLDAELMDRAAKLFMGKHDFSSFMASGSDIADTVRTVFDARVERRGDIISFNVSADGFLYNMVRIMAGTLIDVSRGKIDINKIPDIISSGKRELAGQTAPAHGLYLNRVQY